MKQSNILVDARILIVLGSAIIIFPSLYKIDDRLEPNIQSLGSLLVGGGLGIIKETNTKEKLEEEEAGEYYDFNNSDRRGY